MDEINTQKNKNEILSQLPEVIDLLNTTLKSGMGLSQLLVTVAALVQGALGHELKTLYACQSLGVSVEDSWCQLANQHKFPAFQRFARLIILSETTGYSIVSALENLGLDLKNQIDLFSEDLTLPEITSSTSFKAKLVGEVQSFTTLSLENHFTVKFAQNCRRGGINILVTGATDRERDLLAQTLVLSSPDEKIEVFDLDTSCIDSFLVKASSGPYAKIAKLSALTPKVALDRLMSLLSMQSIDLGSVALHSLHSLLAQSFRLIIHLEILADGSTCIRKVTEVIATGTEGIVLQDIFIFHETGTNQHGQILGASIGVGIIPSLVESLEKKGISIDCAQFSI